VADLFDADPRDVLLTSGGTEANNLALRSAFDGVEGTLIASPMEHPSVLRVAEALVREGRAKLRLLHVLPDGRVDVDDVARAMGEGPARLVAVQAVNHETGVIQDIDAIARIARDAGALFHVDTVQGLGKVEGTFGGADSRSLAIHKLGGPKGIGALVTSAKLRVVPVLLGGSQERGLRPGTVDPIGAAGLAAAARIARTSPARFRELGKLRDRLEAALLAVKPGTRVNGLGPRAPHVTNVWFEGWSGPELVAALDLEGLSVSGGAACSAGTAEASPTLQAMGADVRGGASIRFSMGLANTEDDVDFAAAVVRKVIARSVSR
jgi:cysteine desulfurase